MMGEDAARPRCVAASKHTVSNAPRMIPAVTGSILAEVFSGGRLAASVLFNSNDMSILLCRRSSDRHRNRDVAILRLHLLGARGDIVGGHIAEGHGRPDGAARPGVTVAERTAGRV